MTYRNRALLDVAHGMPCMARFAHECNAHLGCHPAHSNWLEWGRGSGHRAPDWAFATLCGVAHSIVDPRVAPVLDLEQRKAEWLAAYVATQNWLWERGVIRLAPPKERRRA